jgi:hypothetical protein
MPVETKVQASTAAAALSGLALFALGRYVFKGTVPDVVTSWVYVIVPSVITFAAGYLAKHTPRPGDPLPVVTFQPKYRMPAAGHTAAGAPPESVPPLTAMPPTALETQQPPAAT